MSMLIWVTILSMCLAFLICGIPSGLIIARHSAGHVDVRTVGSGNIGMTNVARSAGAGAAALTLLCDAGKGLLAMLLARFLISRFGLDGSWAGTNALSPTGWTTTLCYMSCVFGHVYSPYLKFHGGKGISVGFGAGLGLYWPVALVMLAVFLVFALPSHYVSLGSVAADISLVVGSWLFGIRGWAIVPLVLVCAAVLFAHRKNIGRLLHGTESKFSVHKGSVADPQAKEVK